MDIIRKTTNNTLTIILILLTLTSGTILASATVTRANAASPKATFANYELAGNPFVTGYNVGTSCPNTARSCQNTEGEPQIRADRAGNFYGSSENVFCVIGGLCGGTFAWRSNDNGQHFTTLTPPNSVSVGRPGISPAGGDTDIAVAPEKNINGLYNVYVASLQSNPPLLNVYVSTSTDAGASWSINPTSASVAGDDREWIAADGANKVCISYHAIALTNDIVVDCSYNSGLAFTQHASAFDPAHIAFLAGFNNIIGNLAIDPSNHVIYQVFSSIANSDELASCTIACHVHTVWIAVSINVSVDTAGNVYTIYSDDHNIYYSFSRTFGKNWSGPYQINNAPSKTAIFPWSTAGNAGELDVVWYGTNFYNGVDHPDTYPDTAAWNVYFSQNLNALVPGSSWTQVAASNIIHHGGVCEAGVTCTGNRDLLDDFGVAASPTTGSAVIIYTSDQFVNSTAEPATRRSSTSPFCTQDTNNDIDCEHTNIAVQTGGSTFFQTKHHLQVNSINIDNTNLLGGNSPDFKIQGENTGTVPISSVSVQLSGQPVTFTWSTAFPLQPGQSASAETTTLPLLLVVGDIYQVTITATLSDGTTETQTTSAIYTLGAGLGL